MTDDIERRIEEMLIGEAPQIRQLRELVIRVGPSNIPVLIEGPTGAGKELVARALHLVSRRPGGFVAVNLCAQGESMFEDSLFGHVRGAFTGAIAPSRGYLAEADRGTVFLDEINSLPLALQPKLLRAIDIGEFRPIGGAADTPSDFRVVAASNSCLPDLVLAGAFRRDLYFRLNGVALRVPSLCERLEDVPVLAHHFVRRTAGDRRIHLRASAIRRLKQHSWPGNVRELARVMERVVLLTDGPEISERAIEHGIRLYGVDGLVAPVDEFARARLHRVLEEVGWSPDRAAESLGVHRATVYRRMKRLGILVPSDRRDVAGDAGRDQRRSDGAR